MTLVKKLKEIRKRFDLSQEQLAEIMNVSRQAITKWERNGGIPDISNLQELSKVFGITVDYLLNDENQLPALSMRKVLDKDKYKNKNKISSYSSILKEYFAEFYEIYNLVRRKKMTKLQWVLDLFTWGVHDDIDGISDLSPYYLVKKDNLKFLVNIKDWILEVIELPTNTNFKKISYGNNWFINCGKLNFKQYNNIKDIYNK